MNVEQWCLEEPEPLVYQRPMKSFCFVLAGVLMLFLNQGCEKAVQGYEGSGYLKDYLGGTVTIQFRRDALGAARDLPVSPATHSINGAETTLVGELIAVGNDSLVILDNGHKRWIPREVVLFVQIAP